MYYLIVLALTYSFLDYSRGVQPLREDPKVSPVKKKLAFAERAWDFVDQKVEVLRGKVKESDTQLA